MTLPFMASSALGMGSPPAAGTSGQPSMICASVRGRQGKLSQAGSSPTASRPLAVMSSPVAPSRMTSVGMPRTWGRGGGGEREVGGLGVGDKGGVCGGWGPAVREGRAWTVWIRAQGSDLAVAVWEQAGVVAGRCWKAFGLVQPLVQSACGHQARECWSAGHHGRKRSRASQPAHLELLGEGRLGLPVLKGQRQPRHLVKVLLEGLLVPVAAHKHHLPVRGPQVLGLEVLVDGRQVGREAAAGRAPVRREVERYDLVGAWGRWQGE